MRVKEIKFGKNGAVGKKRREEILEKQRVRLQVKPRG